MSSNDPRYKAIIEICLLSQTILDKRSKEIGVQQSLAESQPYDNMWQEYSAQFKEPAESRQANFAGLLFKRAKLEKHTFSNCNFSKSRWVFSSIKDSDCSGSNFSGTHTLLFPFENTNCSGCDFTDAEINFFDPFKGNNFENANFTNAKLSSAHSFFQDEGLKSRSKFDKAIMNGCTFTIAKEKQPQHNRSKKELKSMLERLFSPTQLSVMHIDYEGKQTQKQKKSGCFIATAACGIDSEEVMVLRRFRDTVLLPSALGSLLVRTYYFVSPPLASLLEGSPEACRLVSNLFVRPVARLVNRNWRIRLKGGTE